jgi:hypothetical protein
MTDDVGPDPFGGEPGAGDDGELATDGDAVEAEPVDEPGEGIAGRLLDGDRDGPSIDDMKNDYGLGQEGAIAGRGIVRLATGGGVPPAFEIVAGGVLGALKLSEDGGPLDREPDDDGPAVGGEGIR